MKLFLKIGIPIIVFVALVSVVIFAIPFPYDAVEAYSQKEPYTEIEYYTEEVPYEDVEYYTEQVPYDDVEYYKETEPYQVQQTVNLRFETANAWEENCGSMFNYIYCLKVNVENVDTAGGTFKLNCEISTAEQKYIRTDSIYIGPGETKTMVCSLDVDVDTDISSKYSVTPGTKTTTKAGTQQVTKERTVTKYNTVMKERTVTKYNTVTKERTVTKYRDVEKERTVTKYATLFNIWTGNVKYWYKV